MITQVKWFSVYEDNMIHINKELAKLKPPKYQIVDILQLLDIQEIK